MYVYNVFFSHFCAQLIVYLNYEDGSVTEKQGLHFIDT